MVRAAHEYRNLDARFLLRGRGDKTGTERAQASTDYNDRQFSQMYFTRLTRLRPTVIDAAKKKWQKQGLELNYVRVLDVPEDKDVFLVGTLYKEMALKPSILDEYNKKTAGVPANGKDHTKFTQAGDEAVLEDEGGRVTLVFDQEDKVGRCVTGSILAVKGRVLPSGDFQVQDTCCAGLAPQEERKSSGQVEKKYVAIVSGFGCGNRGSEIGDESEGSAMLRLQLMLDTCSGILGTSPLQSLAASITRVVIAGGLLGSKHTHLSQPTSYASVREQAQALEPLQDLDSLLAELCETVNVDVMPGVADPTNYSLPQQPLHKCLLPQSTSLSTFNRCTNPHAFEVDGVQFLGTSGQNVDDIMMYSTFESAADILENMLQWRHVIPTAPDSLAAYPFVSEDPFILDKTPHVLFAGGCGNRVETRLVTSMNGDVPIKCRVISVPEFTKDPVLVLVDVASEELDVELITF
jgi:DNA polymerase delta subunit 2